jgi:hypothetical protein
MKKNFLKRKIQVMMITLSATILFVLMLWSCNAPTANYTKSKDSKSNESSANYFDLGSKQMAALTPSYTTSDPTGRMFSSNDGVYMYVFTSSDIDQSGNWPMNQTRCFKSLIPSSFSGYSFSPVNSNGGVILEEKNIPWVKSGSNHLWAPDCYYKWGSSGNRYYLFFPDVINGDKTKSRIGVAISSGDNPTGPYTPESNYMSGVGMSSINSGYASDPGIYFDHSTNKGYMVYCTGDWDTNPKGNIAIVQLSDDMKSGVSTTNKSINTGCNAVYIEGPFLIAWGNYYYLMYSAKWNDNNQQSLCYSMASYNGNPLNASWTYKGAIMDGKSGAASTNWTNHGSIVWDWYGRFMFLYHEGDEKPKSSRTAYLRHAYYKQMYFNSDGTIQKVTP